MKTRIVGQLEGWFSLGHVDAFGPSLALIPGNSWSQGLCVLTVTLAPRHRAFPDALPGPGRVTPMIISIIVAPARFHSGLIIVSTFAHPAATAAYVDMTRTWGPLGDGICRACRA